MNYWMYHIKVEARRRDVLLAFLNELPFESFEEIRGGLVAYLPENQPLEAIEAELNELQTRYPFEYSREWLKQRNWNAEWEAGFQPVLIEDFCGIRADFHAPLSSVRHEIIINPRMAFGTGHHATTWMMIRLMRDLHLHGTKVLDYGCGTGILAILASRLGAAMIDAVDIELEAFRNTLENTQINNTDNIHVLHGTLDAVLDSGYDVILANINRNIILESLETLHHKLKRNGTLLISGILKQDEDFIRQVALDFRFTIEATLYQEGWAALQLLK